MEISQKPIEQLAEIRNMMERSSRFISLSGLSGVAAGIFALIGSGIAFFFLGFDQHYFDMKSYFNGISYLRFNHSWRLIILDALDCFNSCPGFRYLFYNAESPE